MGVAQSAGPDPTFVSVSTNISLKLFPALLSTLTLYSVKKLTENLHTLISEPVKPEWKVHAAAAHDVSAFEGFFSPQSDQVPPNKHITQREWCNFVRLAQAIYFRSIFLWFVFLNHCKQSLEHDVIQMCLSTVSGGWLYIWWDEPLLIQRNCKKTNTMMHLSLSMGSFIFITFHFFAVWSQTVSVTFWEKFKRRPQIVPSPLRHAPTPPAKPTISSDVQYKPQTLPSKHPTTESRP